MRRLLLLLVLVCAAAPAQASAEASWSCAANAGWVAAGGQRADAPGLSEAPCKSTVADIAGASGAGSLTAAGTLALDGGTSNQTTDTRHTTATVSAQSLAIHSADN